MNITSTTPIASQADFPGGTSHAEVAQRQQTATAMRSLNQANMFGPNRELTFTFDRTTHKMVIHVIDRDTRETVMQLPPEYILRLWANQQKGP